MIVADWRTFVLLAVLSLNACGQTGDLYWPEAENAVVDEEEVDPGPR